MGARVNPKENVFGYLPGNFNFPPGFAKRKTGSLAGSVEE
jgi:hypothetical protein